MAQAPNNPAITSLSPATGFCQGGSVAVAFSASGFNAGNVFTAQLSNASGSFASPVAIGTLTATSGGAINATIPTAQAAGAGYRIRIVASSPAATGADNGANLSVSAAPSGAAIAISPAATQIICAGTSVTLSVPLTSGNTYQWRVGGVAISGAAGNTYAASTAGTYTVVVTNAAGCPATSGGRVVNVKPAPTATISPATAQSFCPGGSVAFSVNATSGATYQWFNNGTAIAGATTTAYTATAAGSYSVTVTGSNGCATNSATVAVTANSCAIAISSLSPASAFCQGGSVAVSFTVPGSYSGGNVFTAQLSDAAGSFTSPVAIGLLTATTGGTINAAIPAAQAVGSGYRIRVVSSSPASTGADNGNNLTVNAAPTANISPSSAQTICAGMPVAFSVNTTAGATYQWNMNGSPISGATSSTYSTATAGSYSVTVTGSAGCTATSASVSLTEGGCGPAVTSLSPSGAFCQGGVVVVSFSATGSYNSGNVFTVQLSNATGSFASPVVLGTQTGTTGGTIGVAVPTTVAAGTGYRIRVVSSSPATTGADNGANLTVIAAPSGSQIAISPAATQIICAGTSVTLSVPLASGNTYQWQVGGTAISGATGNTYAVSAAGTYSVAITNAAGCSATSGGRVVNVKPVPTANISPATTQSICGNGSVTFSVNATSGAAYQWKNNSAAISGATTTSYTATTAGNYSVTVTGSNGCAATSATVAVTGCPIAGGGLGGFASSVELSVYPNPSTAAGTLLIQSSVPGEQYAVRVLDMAGRPVLTLSAEAGREAGFGQSLAPGIYTVEAVSPGGGRVVKMWIRQ